MNTIDDLKLLVEVSQLFTLHDLDTVLRTAVDLAARAVGASNASLILYYDGRVDWQYVINIKEQEPDEAQRIVNEILSRGLAGWVMRHQQIALIEDTHNDPRWYVIQDYNEQVRSALSLPLIHRDELVAILTLMHPQPNYFTEHHRQLMIVIANQAAIAIHNLRMLNRVQAQEDQLNTILHAIPDVLLVLDHLGRIVLANRAALDVLGVPSETQTVGRNLLQMPLPDQTLQPVVDWIATQPDGVPLTFETHSQRLNKSYSGVISSWVDQQQKSGYVINLHDITTLRDLARFKDEMLRLASHDLRSPLALIVGYADMIALDTPDPNSPVHQHVEIIHNATTRMNALLEDLLRVEQIRSSPLELQEQVDPFKLAKIALVNMRHAAESKRHVLESRLNTLTEACITADAVLIRQAMENLIGNAIKYTPEGGKITVYTHLEGDAFHFEVEDSGIGIPEGELPHIFDAFYRVLLPDQQDIPGTGLGLSLVKNVIERHGGEVWVTSQLGVGSRFGFKLPLHRK